MKSKELVPPPPALLRKQLSHKETISNLDREIINTIGYEQTLYRGLNQFMNFAIGLETVSVVPSVCATLQIIYNNGGPTVAVWAFLVTWGFMTIVSFSLAELCSIYPAAGSVYNWTGQLAPREYAKTLSYIAGMTNFLGIWAGLASVAAAFSQFFSASLIISGHGGLSLQMQVLVAIVTLFVWAFINIFKIDKIGFVVGFCSFVHMFGTIIIIISLLASSRKFASHQEVWSNITPSETGIHSQSYSFVVALAATLYFFGGFDAPAHVAEETVGSSKTAARGVVWAVLVTGVVGFPFVLTLCYVTTNLDQVLAINTGNMAFNIFVFVFGEKSPLASLNSVIVMMIWFSCGVSLMSITGRITYALCRDQGFPYYQHLLKLNRYQAPQNIILFICVTNAIIQLMPLLPQGAEAFGNILALTVIAGQTSYAFPLVVKLCFPHVGHPKSASFDLGRWSAPFAVLSVAFLLITNIFFLLPYNFPITSSNMNYAIVVVAGFFALCALNYIFFARYYFKGPPQIVVGSSRSNNENNNNNNNNNADASAAADANAPRVLKLQQSLLNMEILCKEQEEEDRKKGFSIQASLARLPIFARQQSTISLDFSIEGGSKGENEVEEEEEEEEEEQKEDDAVEKMSTAQLAVHLAKLMEEHCIATKVTGKQILSFSDDVVAGLFGQSVAKVILRKKKENNAEWTDLVRQMDEKATAKMVADEVKRRIENVHLSGKTLLQADDDDIIDALGVAIGKKLIERKRARK